MNTELKNTNIKVRVPKTLREQIEKYAKDKGCTVSEVIRMGVEKLLRE